MGRGLAFLACGILGVFAFACSLPAGPADESEAAATAPAAGPPWLAEVAQARGIDFVHRSGHSGRHLFPEIFGGGAALLDADGDGDLDAYLVQSGGLETPPAEREGNRLYINRGDGTFEARGAASGAADRGYGMGAAAGDYDNDGDVDLYVTNYGANALLRNDGTGRFEDVTEDAGVGDPRWSTSAVFLDHDADGDLDLYVANYVNWSRETELDCFNNFGAPDFCLPTNYNAPARDTLYRNEGDGTFTDVSDAAGLRASLGNGLGVVAGDFDGDGRIDLFVANDMMMNQLWINLGGDRFEDRALAFGCAVDEHGTIKAGMGIAAADPDDDGDLDAIVVNLQDQTDSFFRNEGSFFVDATASFGIVASSRRYTRFGVGFPDLDNDGYLDLYFANGRVVRHAEPRGGEEFEEPNLLLRGLAAGRFEVVEPPGGTADPLVATSRAAAFGDFDDDGGIDVLVGNRDGPAHLLRNVHPSRGHWLRMQVLDEHGRDALGAVLAVSVGDRRLRRDVLSGYSYCAANDPRVHLGLGERTGVDGVRVHWVDGGDEEFGPFEADRDAVLRRGEGRPPS
jgi:hypothetical protein